MDAYLSKVPQGPFSRPSGVAECKEHAGCYQMDAVRIQALVVSSHLTSEPQSIKWDEDTTMEKTTLA